MTEFWLHRSIPRLDLMKEMHAPLLTLTEEPQEFITKMEMPNGRLEHLEILVGDFNESEVQQRFGHRVSRLLRARSLGIVEGDSGRPPSWNTLINDLSEDTAKELQASAQKETPEMSQQSSELKAFHNVESFLGSGSTEQQASRHVEQKAFHNVESFLGSGSTEQQASRNDEQKAFHNVESFLGSGSALQHSSRNVESFLGSGSSSSRVAPHNLNSFLSDKV